MEKIKLYNAHCCGEIGDVIVSGKINLKGNSILEQSKYLAGENYSIADIATFPWIARHEWHDVGLKKFKHLTRWYNEISKREAVIKGFDLLNREEKIPTP